MHFLPSVRAVILPIAFLAFLAAPTQAQVQALDDDPLPTLNLLDQLGVASPGGDSGFQIAGEYRVAEGGRDGMISLTATMAPEWHVYSLTQPDGGTKASKIAVAESEQYSVVGPFQPLVPPEVKNYEYYSVPIEEHADEVTWTAPIRLAEGVAADSLKIDIKFSGQVCKEVCVEINDRVVEVQYAGVYTEPTADLEPYQVEGAHVELTGALSANQVRPGDTVRLTLTAILPDEWHIYAYEPTDPDQLTKPTLIVVNQPIGWTAAPAVASHEPIEEETGLEDQPLQHYHEGKVTWTVDIRIPDDAAPGSHRLGGLIGLQTCTKRTCDLAKGVSFTANITVGESHEEQTVPAVFSSSTYDAAAEAAEPATPALAGTGGLLDNIETEGVASRASTPVVLLTAFVAGFILNFMPCVLPVIGLKIMAFVQQSGDSRGRILALNLWYCAGLISVFLVLATLAVFVGLGWGQQFSSVTFNVVLASIVFAFGLSFLGVWEIPIPGFVGSGTASDLAAKEGPAGAFFKGVITTVLATPCSGPMLAPALAWAVSQTPVMAYLGFATVGLGMASPYLLIGAFPKLVAFLPKPGAWMDTFKHMMGFVLLGTVVFLLTFIEIPYVVPAFGFMVALWAALWWAGRVPLTESFDKKAAAWLAAAAFATLLGFAMFGGPLVFRDTNLASIMKSRFQRAVDREVGTRVVSRSTEQSHDEDSNELPWQPYSPELLEQLTAEQNTVLVDFTADW